MNEEPQYCGFIDRYYYLEILSTLFVFFVYIYINYSIWLNNFFMKVSSSTIITVYGLFKLYYFWRLGK